MTSEDFVPIKSGKYVLKSGKYQGKSLEELLEINPHYIMMLYNNNYLTIQFDFIDRVRAEITKRDG